MRLFLPVKFKKMTNKEFIDKQIDGYIPQYKKRASEIREAGIRITGYPKNKAWQTDYVLPYNDEEFTYPCRKPGEEGFTFYPNIDSFA
jgi:hypothetical protein